MNNQVLKIKLFQETAVYRNPLTMEIIETYPLPAPSTVLGFLQNMIGLDTKIREGDIPIDLSIQGTYDAILRDYQWYIKGEKKEKYPVIVNALNNVYLIIHLKTEHTLLEKIEAALKDPPYYPYLGRAEDLVLIKEVKKINIEEIEIDYEEIKNPVYIRIDTARKLRLNGIHYKLSTFGKIEEIKIGRKTMRVRNFVWQDYIYVEKDRIEEEIKLEKDEEGDIVWWCMQNQNQ